MVFFLLNPNIYTYVIVLYTSKLTYGYIITPTSRIKDGTNAKQFPLDQQHKSIVNKNEKCTVVTRCDCDADLQIKRNCIASNDLHRWYANQ